jgi:hypothetical protein
MPWGAAIGAVGGIVGGMMQGDAAEEAAQTQANAQREAAQIQAEASKFRPVGITNRFGSSNYTFDDKGYLSGAGYTLSPDLQALQNSMLANANGGALNTANGALTAGQGLFGLGQSYLAQSPQETAQQWMAKQQDLLAPSRDRQFASMLNQNYNQGTTGLSVGATGARPSGAAGLNAANPLAEAYYNAIAQQDAGLAAQANQAGMDQVNFGKGLMGSGLDLQVNSMNPLKGYLSLADLIDKLGSNTLDMGAQIGGRAATANQNVGQALAQGISGAGSALAGAQGNSYLGSAIAGAANNPQLQSAFKGWMTSSPSYSYANNGMDTGIRQNVTTDSSGNSYLGGWGEY